MTKIINLKTFVCVLLLAVCISCSKNNEPSFIDHEEDEETFNVSEFNIPVSLEEITGTWHIYQASTAKGQTEQVNLTFWIGNFQKSTTSNIYDSYEGELLISKAGKIEYEDCGAMIAKADPNHKMINKVYSLGFSFMIENAENDFTFIYFMGLPQFLNEKDKRNNILTVYAHTIGVAPALEKYFNENNDEVFLEYKVQLSK